MSSILINADKETIEILSQLAKKLRSTVINIKDSQYEDFALGLAMENSERGETVDIEEIRKMLKEKS
jgi:predicted transcriptional regulator